MRSKTNMKTVAKNRQELFELARRAQDGEILDTCGMTADESVDAMFALIAENIDSAALKDVADSLPLSDRQHALVLETVEHATSEAAAQVLALFERVKTELPGVVAALERIKADRKSG